MKLLKTLLSKRNRRSSRKTKKNQKHTKISKNISVWFKNSKRIFVVGIILAVFLFLLGYSLFVGYEVAQLN
ncbi:hypothetical protein KC717_02285, partial [Candidatus Dojkabacteria bacterium]|nr:hypothetical protein [Candidatus Dojkabacteria bacterium]